MCIILRTQESSVGGASMGGATELQVVLKASGARIPLPAGTAVDPNSTSGLVHARKLYTSLILCFYQARREEMINFTNHHKVRNSCCSRKDPTSMCEKNVKGCAKRIGVTGQISQSALIRKSKPVVHPELPAFVWTVVRPLIVYLFISLCLFVCLFPGQPVTIPREPGYVCEAAAAPSSCWPL